MLPLFKSYNYIMGIGPPSQFSLYVATSVARVLSCHFMQFLLKVSFCWPVSLGMMALVPLPPPQRVGRKKTRPSDQINRLVNFHTFPHFGFRSIQNFRQPFFLSPPFSLDLYSQILSWRLAYSGKYCIYATRKFSKISGF